MHNRRNIGGRFLTPEWAKLWQPTLTNHDPSPPITLESPVIGGTNYTITASGGAFTHTGQAVSLKRGLKVQATSASYLASGTAAVLRGAPKLVSAAAVYVMNGVDQVFWQSAPLLILMGRIANPDNPPR